MLWRCANEYKKIISITIYLILGSISTLRHRFHGMKEVEKTPTTFPSSGDFTQSRSFPVILYLTFPLRDLQKEISGLMHQERSNYVSFLLTFLGFSPLLIQSILFPFSCMRGMSLFPFGHRGYQIGLNYTPAPNPVNVKCMGG